MRAQLSLELLLYVALAGLSFAFAIGAVSRAWSGLGGSEGAFEMTQLADTINTALLQNGAFSGTVYLPTGMCAANASGNALTTPHGALYFIDVVNTTSTTFCPDGTYANLSVVVTGGTAYFSRS